LGVFLPTSVCEKNLRFHLPKVVKNIWILDTYFVVLSKQHITGISRQQLQISSLEDKITQDNPARFIDAFIENISLEAIGFTVKTLKT
jgi:hypothetical protein